MGDFGDSGLLITAHCRDAGFDLVHTDAVEQAGDVKLFLIGKDDTGGLFAIAQRGVVDIHRSLDFRNKCFFGNASSTDDFN